MVDNKSQTLITDTVIQLSIETKHF